jgi:SnoaL-like domain
VETVKRMDRRAFGAALLVGSAGLAAAGTSSAATSCSKPAGGLGEQDFRDYIAAFNRSDFDGFSKYYAEDVEFEGRGRHFRSRAEVLAFYREVKSRMQETIEIKDIIVGDTDMVANIVTRLQADRDWPEFVTGPIKKGEVILSENFIWYEMKGGKFVHIRSAGYRRL